MVNDMILIKIIQEVLNKTQQDIADDLGVSRQTISMWHSGYKLSKKNIDNINKIYNIPIDLIMKTQVSGVNLSKEDIERIKNTLVEGTFDLYNTNALYYILNLLNENIIFKSDNFSEWLKIIKDFYMCGHINDINEFTLNQNALLIVVYIKNKKLLEIIDDYKAFLEKSNVSLIVCTGNVDRVKYFTFGGNNENIY